MIINLHCADYYVQFMKYTSLDLFVTSYYSAIENKLIIFKLSFLSWQNLKTYKIKHTSLKHVVNFFYVFNPKTLNWLPLPPPPAGCVLILNVRDLKPPPAQPSPTEQTFCTLSRHILSALQARIMVISISQSSLWSVPRFLIFRLLSTDVSVWNWVAEWRFCNK